jgi:cell fate (sporulation/competence/biofilm development) regulator YlbF (YheA/YmcA/DUF963 family)
MTLTERVKEALKEEEKVRESSREFQNLREFYAEKKKEGVAIKHEYTLPLIDTIGHSIQSDKQQRNKTPNQSSHS